MFASNRSATPAGLSLRRMRLPEKRYSPLGK